MADDNDQDIMNANAEVFFYLHLSYIVHLHTEDNLMNTDRT